MLPTAVRKVQKSPEGLCIRCPISYLPVQAALIWHLVVLCWPVWCVLNLLFRHRQLRGVQIGVSIDYLAMIIVGRLGSVLDTIFGALFLTVLPIILRLVMEPFGLVFDTGELSSIITSRRILFGCLIIFLLAMELQGLNRLWRNIQLAIFY